VRAVRTSCAALLSVVCALASGCAQTPPPTPPEAPPDPKPEPTQALPQVLREVVAGYAAKVMASAIFVSHRTLDSVLAEELAPDAPLQAMARPFLSFDVDRDERTVRTHLLGVGATAAFVDGLGCTLLNGVDLATLRARALPPLPAERDPRPWPLGDDVEAAKQQDQIDGKALGDAVAYAFAEREGRPLVHTRAVVVARKGQLLAERYAEGYDAATVLPGWSMSKTWVSALVGMRVLDKALDPQAELPVPEWQKDAADPRRALRLDDLLRMQSGLRWKEDYEAQDSDALRMLFLANDYGSVAASQPLAVPPRTEFRYSSGTTNLICRILRTTFADSAGYLAFARDRLFLPLGMKSALLEPDPSGTFVGSSFGFATARDWAKFGLFYLQDGVWDGRRLLPEGWVASAREPTPTARRGDFGAHLWLNAGTAAQPDEVPFARLPRDLFYLSGHEGQYVVCFPKQQLVVVRLGCAKRGGFDLHGFLERVLKACGG
jgi:CubicO group peptidase (beta-lactamase class C family)